MAEHLDAIVNKRLEWFNALSAEQQAAARADRQAATTDETVKAERMAEMMATFQAADTNQDGLLDKTEFADFMGKMSQNATARGVAAMSESDVDEEMKEKVWGFFNGQTAGTDGVSAADVGAAIQAIGTRTRELVAAQ